MSSDVAARPTIALTIPASPDLVRPVRLAAGGLASLGTFDVETIEELRLAVNELIGVLIDQGAGGDIELNLALVDDAFRMEARTAAGESDDAERLAFADRILSVMADDHGIDISDGQVSGWFIRHADAWADGGDGDDT